jgi:hypothetical protein
MIMMIPVLIVFIAAQRLFMGGLEQCLSHIGSDALGSLEDISR